MSGYNMHNKPSPEDKAIVEAACRKACAAVIAQGKQAVNPNTSICQYRMPCEGGTLKCAIGHLLTDDQISGYKIREGTSPHDFDSPLLHELLPGISNSFWARLVLTAVQNAHDNALSNDLFVEDFKKRANEVANSYGLDPIA